MWSTIIVPPNKEPGLRVKPDSGDRIVALVIDACYIGIWQIVFIILVSIILGLFEAGPEIVFAASSLVVPFIYCVAYWSLTSSSPGKRVQKLKIRSLNGDVEKISVVQALLRYVGLFLLPLSIIRFFLNNGCLPLHDEIANTEVVYSTPKSRQ